MTRYVSKPRSVREWWEGRNPYEALTVHEEDRPTFTGLFDHEGRELHTVRQPMGFLPGG